MNDRASHLAASFRDITLSIGGRTLRPLTAGSMMILQELRNPLFYVPPEDADPAAGQEEDAMESFLAILQFVWVHTAPMDEVMACVEPGAAGPAIARRAALRLSMEFGIEDLQAFGLQFADLKTRLESGMTEAVPEGPPGKPAPSPTGLPAWSTPSADVETPPASDGYSGDSRSTAPCSISTPDSATREPASAGPAPVPAAGPNVIPLPSLPLPGSAG